jgi:hypothetical protein
MMNISAFKFSENCFSSLLKQFKILEVGKLEIFYFLPSMNMNNEIVNVLESQKEEKESNVCVLIYFS